MKKKIQALACAAMLAVGGFNVWTAMDGGDSTSLKLYDLEMVAEGEAGSVDKKNKNTIWKDGDSCTYKDGSGWEEKVCDYSNSEDNDKCVYGEKQRIEWAAGQYGPPLNKWYEGYKEKEEAESQARKEALKRWYEFCRQ